MERTHNGPDKGLNGVVNPDELKSDIARTRRAMDQTLDQLGEKLNPRKLMDHMLDFFRGPGSDIPSHTTEKVTDFGRSIADSIRTHPITSLFAAAAAAAVIFENGEKKGKPLETAVRPPEDEVDVKVEVLADEGGSEQALAGMAERARDASSRLTGSARSTAQNLSSRVGSISGKAKSWLGSRSPSSSTHSLGGAKEYLTDKASRAAEYGRHMGSMAGNSYSSSVDRIRTVSSDYPLAVGAASFTLGLLCGLGLPRTRAEESYIGPASEDLVQGLKSKSRELAEKGKEAAKEAARGVVSSAEDQLRRVGSEEESGSEQRIKELGGQSDPASGSGDPTI